MTACIFNYLCFMSRDLLYFSRYFPNSKLLRQMIVGFATRTKHTDCNEGDADKHDTKSDVDTYDMMPLLKETHGIPAPHYDSATLNGISKLTDRICVQHLLNTTIPLFDLLEYYKEAEPGRFWVTGKCYSTYPPVIDELKRRGYRVQDDGYPKSLGGYYDVMSNQIQALFDSYLEYDENRKQKRTEQEKGLILLDEGGRLVKYIPLDIIANRYVVGVEQTSAGFFSKRVETTPFPMISVAGSAVKRLVEAPLIIEANTEKLISKIPLASNESIFGVVGLGALGSKFAELLVKQGKQVVVYDVDPVKVAAVVGKTGCDSAKTLAELVSNVNIIGGFSGRDISREFNFLSLSKEIILFSGSSEDKEFKTLLSSSAQIAKYSQTDPSSDVTIVTNNNGVIKVLYRGYPLNFSNKGGFSVPPRGIVITRAMMGTADTQALVLVDASRKGEYECKNPGQVVMLDPAAQQKIARHAFAYRPDLYGEKVQRTFESLDSIAAQSMGKKQDELVTKPSVALCVAKQTSVRSFKNARSALKIGEFH
jgi:hypothetical protein